MFLPSGTRRRRARRRAPSITADEARRRRSVHQKPQHCLHHLTDNQGGGQKSGTNLCNHPHTICSRRSLRIGSPLDGRWVAPSSPESPPDHPPRSLSLSLPRSNKIVRPTCAPSHFHTIRPPCLLLDRPYPQEITFSLSSSSLWTFLPQCLAPSPSSCSPRSVSLTV